MGITAFINNFLLRQMVTEARLREHGADELRLLVEPIVKLSDYAPDLVALLYRNAFAYEETSKEETSIGGSVILPLRSNRRQDYEGGLYSLRRAFPEFLRVAPGLATTTLMEVLDQARKSYLADYPGLHWDPALSFEVYGTTAYIEVDITARWDEMPSRRADDVMHMWSDFRAHVRDLAKTMRIESGILARRATETLEEILAHWLSARPALVWRGLLEEGAEDPTVIGRRLAPLAWAQPLLATDVTRHATGRFLVAVFSLLKPDERGLVENVLLGAWPIS